MLETLQLPSTYKLRADVQETDEGFPGTKYGGILDFDEAFEHYIDHTELEKAAKGKVREDMLKSQFLLDLLHNDYGLCCVVLCIGASRYVILDND